MSTLIIFVVLVAAAWIGVNYLKMRRNFKLRHAARPPKALIEVLLPRDIKDANERMARFYRMAANLTVADGPDRRDGKGQLDILFYATRLPGRMAPTLYFMIECDADKLERVKKSINTCFDGDAAVVPVEKHPFAELEAQLLAHDAKDGQGAHQVVA